ncbi:protein FAM124A [Lampris incognitus]|uniref:protein FAM124A n=1 Tax=Lampris incognitus TaxID=2546036 RepID=UPI0024B57B21|nr:protein FAM124A [Lampris incognitus]
MEKPPAEDECVDSGAETGGAPAFTAQTKWDKPPEKPDTVRGGKHSEKKECKKHADGEIPGELSMGELQDPFLVSVHLIADPGHGKFLQRAADSVLAWVHPELQLFRVSERGSSSQSSKHKRHQNGGPAAACQPALAVILFLQESYGGEEHILTLHRALQRPPWHYHHTEKVSNGRRMLPLTPCSQDFFTLAPGTPLWAVRQVHYGKEIVRFTIYCSHENYADMVRLYKMLLQRRVAQKREDFCFFVVYTNPDTEIQLSFKRLPRGESPMPLGSAVMEVRVQDMGVLVPLLPRPCSPISDVRWQTEDYDGNKILLQVQGARFRCRQDPALASSASAAESASAPSTFSRSATSYRNRRYHRMSSRMRVQSQSSYNSLPLACEEREDEEQWADGRHPDAWMNHWRSHRSNSLFSIPNPGSGGSRSTCSSPGPSPSLHYRSLSLSRSSSLVPPFRLNVEALIGAEETDVDTGKKVETSSNVDLTVVSAYIKPSLPRTPRPLSAPPEDIGPPLSPGVSGCGVGKASTLGRPPVPTRTSSLSNNSRPSSLLRSRPPSTSVNTSESASLSDVSLNQWGSSSSINGPVEKRSSINTQKAEQDDQEFYI